MTVEDRVCGHVDQFVTEYRGGGSPDLWAYLARERDPAVAGGYLCRLLHEAFALRIGRGERPWIDDYIRPELWPHRRAVCGALTTCLFGDGGDLARELGIERFGPYRVEQVLGFGGFGTALRAVADGGPGRPLVVKIGHRRSDPAAAQLRNEARVLRQVGRTAGLPTLIGADQHPQWGTYLVCDFVAGEPLSAWLKGTRSDASRLYVCKQLAGLVRHLHGVGRVYHGDLSPENVLVGDDGVGPVTVHLIDFGDAGLGFRPQSWLPVITRAYAAPELLRGPLEAGDQADVWSLGVLVYEVLAGSHPFAPVDDFTAVPDADWLERITVGRPYIGLPDRFGDALRQVVADSLHPSPQQRGRTTAVHFETAMPAVSQVGVGTGPGGPSVRDELREERERLTKTYLGRLVERFATITVPLADPRDGQARVPIGSLVIDLPLSVEREVEERHARDRLHGFSHAERLGADRKRSSPTCQLGERLARCGGTALVGEPGSGKSTLLAWAVHQYAARATGSAVAAAEGQPEVPAEDRLPVVLVCRDLLAAVEGDGLENLLDRQLQQWQFTRAQREVLTPALAGALAEGRAFLFVDGLDEIPDPGLRRYVCRLLNDVAALAGQKVLATSRVVGFRAVQGDLPAFDVLMIDPIPNRGRRAYVERWAALRAGADVASLLFEMGERRRLGRLCENALMLALVTQVHVVDGDVPRRRTDLFRRLVAIMLERQRAGSRDPLTHNEVWPHLEHMAYRMRVDGVQDLIETDVRVAFAQARAADPDELEMRRRTPQELLDDVLERLGLLNVAGLRLDTRKGLERRAVQFFHQSLQEYFAGQAMRHGRGGPPGDPLARLRRLVVGEDAAGPEVGERRITSLANGRRSEPTIAEKWQEAVSMCVAELGDAEDTADSAIRLILPGVATPAPQARARTVLALRCLAEEPPVDERTVHAVVDAMIDVTIREDGINSDVNTLMDEAFELVAGTRWGPSVRGRLLKRLISGDERRLHEVGRWYMTLATFSRRVVLDAENCDVVLSECLARVDEGDVAARVDGLLRLAELFYRVAGVKGEGSLDFVGPVWRDRCLNALLPLVADPHDSVSGSALWALGWMLRAKFDRPKAMSWLTNGQAALLEPVLAGPNRADLLVEWAARLIVCRAGDTLAFAQPEVRGGDWVYSLAYLADGAMPRREWHPPRPLDRPGVVSLLEDVLRSGRGERAKTAVSVSLGRLGHFVPEMGVSLSKVFLDDLSPEDDRDEAMLYLACSRSPRAAEAFRTALQIGDDELKARGLFGLIALDDAHALARELSSGNDHSGSFLTAYAYALAGSQDPEAIRLLAGLRPHPNAAVADAVETALAKAERWGSATSDGRDDRSPNPHGSAEAGSSADLAPPGK